MHLSHNAGCGLLGQTAEDWYVPNTPHPTAAEIAQAEHYARCQGWDSVADRDAVLAHLRAWAARIIAHRANVLRPCGDFSVVLEELENRVADGRITLPAQPWKAGAVGDLCKVAARAEWRVEEAVREREAAALVPVSDDPDAVLARLGEAEADDVADLEGQSDALVQLVVTERERVDRESAAFAERREGLVARVLAAVGLRRAA